MKNKKFGVFDFDGTIADTMPVYFHLSSQIIEKEYGLDATEFEKFSMLYTGIPIDDLFERFLVSKNKPTDKIGEHIKNFFATANAMDFPLFEGAKETIENIYNKGIKLFISTGSQTDKTKERLEKSGILKYFSLVYGSSEIDKGPKHIEDFADFSGLSLEEFSASAFFIGDGPGDMKIAKACKMNAIGVPHTFEREYLIAAGADFVLERITDLSEFDFGRI
jgi:phosphoglycolate phosphatase-like HAD superfamily hydrolase